MFYKIATCELPFLETVEWMVIVVSPTKRGQRNLKEIINSPMTDICRRTYALVCPEAVPIANVVSSVSKITTTTNVLFVRDPVRLLHHSKDIVSHFGNLDRFLRRCSAFGCIPLGHTNVKKIRRSILDFYEIEGHVTERTPFVIESSEMKKNFLRFRYTNFYPLMYDTTPTRMSSVFLGAGLKKEHLQLLCYYVKIYGLN